MKVFIDANIVLDLLLQRRFFYLNAEKIFALSDRGRITLCLSAVSFGSITYHLHKYIKGRDVKSILRDLSRIVRILPFNQNVIDNALYSNFKDIEDAYQYFTAKENNIPIIITRNTKDFLVDDISVITPEQFLNMYRNN